MGVLFEQFSSDPIKGKDVTIERKYGEEFFISERDEIYCYAGMLLKDDQNAIDSLYTRPYYMNGKHSTDEGVTDKILGFHRIVDGRIVLDNYVDNRWSADMMYKQLNAVIRYPSAETYYGVLVNHEEDKDLTSVVFGLTYDELSQLTECYAKALGAYSAYRQYPRVTRSVRSANRCDITNAWIPAKFPYITFAESDCDFSHISLWGFYRYIQLLMNRSIQSPFGQLLVKLGADPALLEKVLKIGCNVYGVKMITWDMLINY